MPDVRRDREPDLDRDPFLILADRRVDAACRCAALLERHRAVDLLTLEAPADGPVFRGEAHRDIGSPGLADPAALARCLVEWHADAEPAGAVAWIALPAGTGRDDRLRSRRRLRDIALGALPADRLLIYEDGGAAAGRRAARAAGLRRDRRPAAFDVVVDARRRATRCAAHSGASPGRVPERDTERYWRLLPR